MRLKRYLEENQETEAHFGARIGTIQQTVHGWTSGRSIPRREEMRRIYVATGGEVQPNDFYDLPEIGVVERTEAAA